MPPTAPPDFVATATKSQFPHLQWCHIIWTVQRLAEMEYSSRLFKELYVKINLSGRGTVTLVGHLTVQQVRVRDAVGDVNATVTPSTLLAPSTETSPESMVNKTSISSTNSDMDAAIARRSPPSPIIASTTLSRLSDDEPMVLDLVYLQDAQRLLPLSVFLTCIRAMARIAVSAFDEPIPGDSWDYADSQCGISVHVTNIPTKGLGATWGELNESLEYLAKCMRENKRFAEMEGFLYRQRPEKVEFATVTFGKIGTPATLDRSS